MTWNILYCRSHSNIKLRANIGDRVDAPLAVRYMGVLLSIFQIMLSTNNFVDQALP